MKRKVIAVLLTSAMALLTAVTLRQRTMEQTAEKKYPDPAETTL